MKHTRMIRLTIVTILTGAFMATAQADEFQGGPIDGLIPSQVRVSSSRRRPGDGRDGRPKLSVSAGFRTSAIVGILDTGLAGIGLFDTEIDYSDVFGAGRGFELEGALLWKVAEGNESSNLVGPYLSLGVDSYNGGSEGDLVADDWEMITALAGLKFRLAKSRDPRRPTKVTVAGDFHVGLGVVQYESTDGFQRIGGSQVPVEFFKASTKGAFDMGGRLGIGSETVMGQIGIGFRIQGPPSSSDLDLDSSAAFVFWLDLGITFTF